MILRKIISFLAAVSIIGTAGCSKISKEPLTYTGTAFDTVINIQIYDAHDQELIEGCQSLCEEYENMLSRTIEGSDIYQINHANGAATEVSPDTITLINKGIYYGDMSNGAFDITVGTLSDLWDFKAENPSVPSQETIYEATKHVNYKKIVVDGTSVKLLDPQAKLDLGGLAKGFIADKLKEYLKSQGVKHALINLGGNVLAVGSKLDGSAFNIGIQKPFDETGEPITTAEIDNQTIVTSGNYQRFFEQDGKIYHHIIDPKTGYPCDNTLNSVTIITDSSLTADALSTTCFLLGSEFGMKLINQLDNVDAVFIDKENNITYSRNYKH